MTIQNLAEQFASAFETGIRANGNEYRRLKANSPKWMHDVIQNAYDGYLPNDYVYAFCESAADYIANIDDTDDIDFSELEPNIYTSNLIAWLSSDLHSMGYVTEAMQAGVCDDAESLLGYAQSLQMQVIANSVYESLEDLHMLNS